LFIVLAEMPDLFICPRWYSTVTWPFESKGSLTWTAHEIW